VGFRAIRTSTKGTVLFFSAKQSGWLLWRRHTVKALAEKSEQQGIITDHGIDKMADAFGT